MENWKCESGTQCAQEADKQGLVRYGTAGVAIVRWSSKEKAPASVRLLGSVTCPNCSTPMAFEVDCDTDCDLLSGPKVTCPKCSSRVDFSVWARQSQEGPSMFVTGSVFSRTAGNAGTMPVVSVTRVVDPSIKEPVPIDPSASGQTGIVPETTMPNAQPDKAQIKANLVAKLQELQNSDPRLALALAQSMTEQFGEDVMVGEMTLRDFIGRMEQARQSAEHFDSEKDQTYMTLKADIASREYIRLLGFPAVANSISSGEARTLGERYIKIALFVMKERRVIRDTSLSAVTAPPETAATTAVEIPLYGPCKGQTLKIGAAEFTFLSELFKKEPQTGACFIATACYGSYDHPAVKDFRRFRDTCLNRTALGRFFVKSYYTSSPPFADFLQARPWLASAVRILILSPVGRLIGTLERRPRQ